MIRDRETATYADFRKVAPIHFEGKFFRCRGPSNTVRSPQGRPTLIQAGGSPSGRDFAAQHADSVVCVTQGTANMRAYRDDIRARAIKHGRNPDDLEVLFLVAPVLAETESEARARYERRSSDPGFLEANLADRRGGDGLVPALQRRGLVRTEYTHTTLRENLRAF